jgi:ribonuclease R
LIIHRILKWALENPEATSPGRTPGVGARHAVPAADRARHTPVQNLSAQSAAEKSAAPQSAGEAVRYMEIQLREIATESSEAERRAAAAERELMDWKTAQFMEQHIGEEFAGLIISIQKFGAFVELAEVFVEGLLPIAAFEEAAGARCIYREFDHSIVAMSEQRRSRASKPATQRSWHLGNPVQVRAERIDPIRKRVEFALVDPPTAF